MGPNDPNPNLAMVGGEVRAYTCGPHERHMSAEVDQTKRGGECILRSKRQSLELDEWRVFADSLGPHARGQLARVSWCELATGERIPRQDRAHLGLDDRPMRANNQRTHELGLVCAGSDRG